MKLWSGLLSPFSAKVRIVLAEKKLDYETLEVPWSRETKWGPKPPEFLAVSPRGEVPVLIDDDTTVFDSTRIAEYLEDRHPQPPLFPADAAERALCRRLEEEADEAMALHVTPLVQELFTETDESARDRARVATASAALERFYDDLERHLHGREHLCKRFSVADIATFMVLGFASTFGVAPAERHANLRRWLETVRARPSVAREFVAMLKGSAAV